MTPTRIFGAVALCAVVVHLGALGNRFALDDQYLVVTNPLVRSGDLVAAFISPYWPPDLGGQMYRPLATASFALDWQTASTTWFHLVNLLWHAAATVAVALLGRRLAGDRAGLVAGLLFAVHPVHVEAVANVVGRTELMAAGFSVLAVYAALARRSVGWSAAALALGLLSKENAAVTPALVAWGWIVGLDRPPRRVMLRFAAAWAALGAVYLGVRWWVIHPYARLDVLAPVFFGETPLTVRLTAVAALSDVARLLLFPLTLRADYGPAERTAVPTPLDLRFALGALAAVAWAALLVWAWRRERRIEAFGLGWIAIAFLPVANLLFPTGVLVAERTLYLPTAGLALAAGGLVGGLPTGAPRALSAGLLWRPLLAVAVLGAAVRSALRVPVWRDDISVVESLFVDSPRSYRGHAQTAALLLSVGQPAKALEEARRAAQIYDRDPTVFLSAADAAFTLGRPALADTLLARVDQLCGGCPGGYRVQARGAFSRGDAAVADSFLVRAERLSRP